MRSRNGIAVVGALCSGLAGCGTGAPTSNVPMPVEHRVAVPLGEPGDSATAEFLIPAGIERIAGVLVFIDRGLDEYAFDNRDWRAACARLRCALLRVFLPARRDAVPAEQPVRNARIGGSAALLAILDRLAAESGHPELAAAPLLLWGFSAAGNFGPTFAEMEPGRTLGYIRYHSNMRGIEVDVARISPVPALIIAGGADEVAGTEDSERFFRRLRSAGGPGAFIVAPSEPHYSVDGLLAASPLMLRWIEGVFALRRAEDEGQGAARLVNIDPAAGWYAEPDSGTMVPATAFPGDPASFIWLPDEPTAAEWKALLGACAAVPEALVLQALGPGAARTDSEADTCVWSEGVPTASRTLTVLMRGQADSSRARETAEALRSEYGGSAAPGLPPDGFVFLDEGAGCRVAVARRDRFLLQAIRCGPGADEPGTDIVLGRILHRLFGTP